MVLFEEESLHRETEESAPMGLCHAEDRRKSCLFMGKRGVCNSGKCLKRKMGSFHEVACADRAATSGASQPRRNKSVFYSDRSLLNISAGFCCW